jgi:hypothetical protein
MSPGLGGCETIGEVGRDPDPTRESVTLPGVRVRSLVRHAAMSRSTGRRNLMRKIWALSLVAVLCLAVVAIAGEDKMGAKPMEGKITKVDMAAKTLIVTDAAGKESTLYWNETTKVEGGELKEGETLHYKAMEKDGKMWATWLHVGEMHKM